MKPPTPTKKEIASESVMLPFCASSAMPESGYANAKRCADSGTLNASRVAVSHTIVDAGESLPCRSRCIGSLPDGVPRPPVDAVGAPPSHTLVTISGGTL